MSLPKHLAIIMDGNGRWAQAKRKPRTFGHIKGARVAKKIITACVEKKIPYLTLYAFSSENWLRPQAEVSFLMTILQRYLKRETANLVKQNIRFQVVGDLARLPKEVLQVIDQTQRATEKNTGLVLTFALSYGSRQEITSAVSQLIEEAKSGLLEKIDESVIHSRLWTATLPDPDLILRTSGEQRLSNFLLWQAAYAEFFFSPTLWPDFTVEEFDQVLAHFSQRSRRFGTIEVVKPAHH